MKSRQAIPNLLTVMASMKNCELEVDLAYETKASAKAV